MERSPTMPTDRQVRILLIEDNPDDAALVRAVLGEETRTPFQLRDAASLAEGLACLGGERVDVILLDLGLPDSHGLGTLEQILQRAPQVPVVVLTGRADEELGLQAVQIGAQDSLAKKFIGLHLVRAICYAVERHRADSRR